MTISLRVASEHDAEAACQVLRRSISELCVSDHHNDEKILAAWLKNKTPEHVRDRIKAGENFTVVALRDGCVCGIAMITNQGEIQLCYASPEVRFLGAGKLMLQALEQQALRWGLNKVFLTSTLTAQAFYERNGFTLSGVPTTHRSGLKSVFPMAKQIGL